MSGPNVGYATLSVIPSARGFKAALTAEVAGPLAAVSRDISRGSKHMDALAGAGGAIVSVMGKATKAVGGVALAAAGLALKGGFSRAMAIEDAQAALRGLGHDTQSIEKIMDSALASVKGTAFGLGDAATIASTAVAAGIKPGEELTRTLTLTANAAALARIGLDEMGSILNKVWTSGRVTTEEMNQLADRGIPIWTKLAESYGVSAIELRRMVEQGKVDSETFATVLEDTVGNAALAMGDTTRGAWQNMLAAASRAGESFLQGVWPLFKRGLSALTEWLDRIAPKVEEFGAAFSEWIRDIAPKIREFADAMMDRLAPAVEAVASAIWDDVLPALRDFAGWVLENQPALVGFATFVGTVLVVAVAKYAATCLAAAAAQAALWAPVIAIAAAIGLLVAGVIWAYQNVDWFRSAVDAVGRFLRDTLWPILQSVAGFLMTVFAGAWDAVSTAATWLWNNVLQPLWDWFSSTAMPIISDLADNYLAALAGAFEVVGTVASEVWNDILQPLASWISGTFVGIIQTLTGAWEALKGAIDAIASFGADAFSGLVAALDRLPGPLGAVVDAAKSAFDALNDFLGLSRSAGPGSLPSVATEAKRRKSHGSHMGGLVPEHLASGGVLGLHPGSPRGTDTIPAWLTPGEFVIRKSSVDKFGVDFLHSINAGRIPNLPGGSSAIRSSGRGMGENWGTGLRDGIDRMWSGVVQAAHRIAGAVTSTTKKDWGVASPAKVAQGLGRSFGDGLIIGISDGELEARRAAAQLASAAVDGVESVNPEFERLVDSMTSKLWDLDRAFRDMSPDNDQDRVTANDFIKALRADTKVLAKFQRDLQAIAKAGYRDLSALLVQRGPETAGMVADRLAEAARTGNAKLLDDLRSSIAQAEKMYNDLARYIRDEIAPMYVDEFVVVASDKITAAAERLSRSLSNALRTSDPVADLGSSFSSFVDSATRGIATINDAFRDVDGGGDGIFGVGDVLAALRADSDAMSDYRDDLQAIASVSADVAGVLAQRGPQGSGRVVKELADAVRAGNTSTVRELRTAFAEAERTYAEIASFVRDELAPQVVLTSGVLGGEIADAFASGLSFDDRMRIAAKAAGLALSEEGRAIALIAATEGEAAALNYALALKLEPATVEEGLKAAEALKKLPKSPFSQAGASIGEAFADGLSMGMVAARMDVVLQAALLGVEMAKATRAALKSSSPSKVAIAIGEDFGDGLAIGIAQQSAAVVAAAEYIARAAADGASLGGPIQAGVGMDDRSRFANVRREFAGATEVEMHITVDGDAIERRMRKKIRTESGGNVQVHFGK